MIGFYITVLSSILTLQMGLEELGIASGGVLRFCIIIAWSAFGATLIVYQDLGLTGITP